MKYISTALLIVLLCNSAACQNQNDSCRHYTKDGWKIVYNSWLKKYAIASEDLSYWIAVDENGKYGLYGDNWVNTDCYGYSGCADKSKSLFKTACGAKVFLLEYFRWLKTNKWK